MRIRALSVFEGVVHHCWCLDDSNPCRPTLEIEAVVRPGDVDCGPVLLPWADFVHMVGVERARACAPAFRAAGRLVDRMGVTHLAFPLWAPGDMIHA